MKPYVTPEVELVLLDVPNILFFESPEENALFVDYFERD